MEALTKEGISGPFSLHPEAADLPDWTHLGVECASLFVVTLAFWVWRQDRQKVAQIGALMFAGWAAETIAMAWYDYYAYAPGWRLWLGHVPLAVIGVWPIVIITSYQVVKATLGHHHSPLRIGLFTGLMVVFDAAFIEPVAVRMGLWAWQDGTYFGVPTLGYVGWGFLGFAAGFVFEHPRLKQWAGLSETPRLLRSWFIAGLSMVLICHVFLAPCVFAAIESGFSIPLSLKSYSLVTLGLGIALGVLGFKVGHLCPFRFRDFWLLIAGSTVFFISIYIFWLEPFVWSLATWPALFWGLGLVPFQKAT
jgi:hypothetical protein